MDYLVGSQSVPAPPTPPTDGTFETHVGNSFTAMQVHPTPKRKRSIGPETQTLPTEIPETPWRDNEAAVLRQESPHREKLAGHFHSMKLAEDRITIPGDEMEVEVEQEARPATKRRRETKKTGKAIEPLEVGNGNGKLAAFPPAEMSNDQAPTQVQEQRSKRLRSPPPPPISPDESENQGKYKSTSPEDDDESDPDVYGIAYIPTPMQRYARSQKRMQQVHYLPLIPVVTFDSGN
ncbi:hypothetical protein K440DRAFT_619651 [Wilcoxina mikolae CBS 423.85]|nr:hypothetical protein K440DRAFT_619651 [Wilcoxina mikolae CBS 423.85]